MGKGDKSKMNRDEDVLDTKGDNGELITLDEIEFSKIPFSKKEIEKYSSENDYMRLIVEMFKEMVTINHYNSNALRLDEKENPRYWTRDEAILGGMMVRLTKLLMGIIDLTCQHKWEIANILFRSAIETGINIRFLIKKNTKDAFQEYIKYSLKSEKKLWDRIKLNIKESGEEQPIEKRMKKSIKKSFLKSGYKPDEIDYKQKSWGGSIYNRFEKVGWQKIYLGGFVLPSHAVHGNWEDILRNHIKETPSGYKPDSSWTNPRPQPLIMLILLVLEVNIDYLNDLLPECDDKTELLGKIDDLQFRAMKVNSLHEQFLQKNAN